MTQSGGSQEPHSWSRNGTLELPSGEPVEYGRESTDLTTLTIDDRVWDLRDGAVFEILTDGRVIQHPVYPPFSGRKTWRSGTARKDP